MEYPELTIDQNNAVHAEFLRYIRKNKGRLTSLTIIAKELTDWFNSFLPEYKRFIVSSDIVYRLLLELSDVEDYVICEIGKPHFQLVIL